MPDIETLRSLERIKVLADPRRLEILRLLMAGPATLSQLAARVGHSAAWVRHHLKGLEAAGLVSLAEVRTTGRVTEKFYRARSGGLLLEQLIVPKARTPVVVFAGSHDLALQAMVDHFSGRPMCLTLYVGSLNGLMNLRQGLCEVSGAHLLDTDGTYNSAFVHRFFPDQSMELVTLAHRTQGLMLPAANPRRIRQVTDLARPGIRFLNRNRGSGTRIWVERELARARVSTASIRGFQREAKTHTETARAVMLGKADVAVGLEAAARACGLTFVPLFEERYDLVLPRRNERHLQPFLDYLQTRDFRQTVNAMAGYNAAHSGEQIPI